MTCPNGTSCLNLLLLKRRPDPLRKGIAMATNPNVPPPEPVVPLSTPPEPGEVQTTPMPMYMAQAAAIFRKRKLICTKRK